MGDPYLLRVSLKLEISWHSNRDHSCGACDCPAAICVQKGIVKEKKGAL